MSQNQKTFKYLDPASWIAMEAALHKLLPNYNLGQVNGVMCNYGFTSDRRKALHTFRIESYRASSRYKGQMLESREFRAQSVEDALKQHNPNGRFEKCIAPRLSKEEQAADVLHYDWLKASKSAKKPLGEEPGLYLKVWPL